MCASFLLPGLLDYNVSVFKAALGSVFDMSRKSVPQLTGAVGGGAGGPAVAAGARAAVGSG
jgi:hypothetical protein